MAGFTDQFDLRYRMSSGQFGQPTAPIYNDPFVEIIQNLNNRWYNYGLGDKPTPPPPAPTVTITNPTMTNPVPELNAQLGPQRGATTISVVPNAATVFNDAVERTGFADVPLKSASMTPVNTNGIPWWLVLLLLVFVLKHTA